MLYAPNGRSFFMTGTSLKCYRFATGEPVIDAALSSRWRIIAAPSETRHRWRLGVCRCLSHRVVLRWGLVRFMLAVGFVHAF